MIFSFQELLWFYSLAIFFLLTPGVLICLAINPMLDDGALTSPIGIVAFGFCFSLLLNYFGLFCFSVLGITLTYYLYALSFLIAALGIFCFARKRKIKVQELAICDIAVLLTGLVSSVILYFNGGIIDLLADGWWHMSMIREIMDESTLLFSQYHLTGQERGMSVIDYPMLWHSNVALLGYYSPLSLPKIWHLLPSFNIWPVLFAYFFLAQCFNRSRVFAVTAVLLFCVSYGGLNSYFRLMGWPGNVAYVGWYLSYYLFFTILEQVYTHRKTGFSKLYFSPKYTLFLVMCGFMALTHGVPVALFAISMAFLVYSILIVAVLEESKSTNYWSYLKSVCIIFLPFIILGSIVGALLFPRHFYHILEKGNVLHLLTLAVLLAVPTALLLISKTVSLRFKLFVQVTFLVVVALLLIDYPHLFDLFDKASLQGKQIPEKIQYFGEFKLLTPKWEHQLRGSLLFGGGIAIALSCYYLFSGQYDRNNLFIFCSAILSFLCLSSPLLFNLITLVIHSSSAYRIHMLIFSPIIMAMVIQHALIRKQDDKTANH